MFLPFQQLEASVIFFSANVICTEEGYCIGAEGYLHRDIHLIKAQLLDIAFTLFYKSYEL